ncbi:MAG: phosphatidylglycerol lysyltransferase domain-containing protein [Bacteroidota bacterium]
MVKKLSKLDYLPLSWIYSQENNIEKHVKLWKSTYWLYSGEIANISSFHKVLNNFYSHPKTELVIRGCNKIVSKQLMKLNFSSIIIGKEAIIELNQNPFTKKSLKELVKRGLKFGHVEEVQYSEKALIKLEELKSNSAHSKEPQLKYLFVDHFINETRLFVFVNNHDSWEGAILVSKNSPNKIQAELLLRRKSAPNGIMEALIYYTYKILKLEGYSEFSLGEVPFIADSDDIPYLSMQFIINIIGRMFKYAYNYEGLYFFKNKFATKWKNIYLCVRREFKFKHIFMIAYKSKLISLALYKLLK